MLRFGSASGVDFTGFQAKYNLSASGNGVNTFSTISDAVRLDYPQVDIQFESFKKDSAGAKLKIARLRDLVESGVLCCISVSGRCRNACHIVPVVEVEGDSLTAIWDYPENATLKTRDFAHQDLEDRHTDLAGGNDIAYFERNDVSDD